MFSQACVKNSVQRGTCVTGGMCGGGHAWQGGMHGRGHVWQGMRGSGRACVVGEMATAADCTHPTGMHCCCVNSFSVLSIWN